MKSGLERMWITNKGKIVFPEAKNWTQYVDSRRLEITCGEAPYLVSTKEETLEQNLSELYGG